MAAPWLSDLDLLRAYDCHGCGRNNHSQQSVNPAKAVCIPGFLYDLLLALGAHIALPEVMLILPLSCLGIWGFCVLHGQQSVPEVHR
jgi:hypothetical protein